MSGKIYAEKDDWKRMRIVYEQKMSAEIESDQRKEQYDDAMKTLEEQMQRKRQWARERNQTKHLAD